MVPVSLGKFAGSMTVGVRVSTSVVSPLLFWAKSSSPPLTT